MYIWFSSFLVSELDIAIAQNMILQNIKWRQRNNVSGIMHEDWSDLMQDYHFSHDARDKLGRPCELLTQEFLC